MESHNSQFEKNQTPRLRALIEIRGGELHVYPLCDSDGEEKQIIDALRFLREDFRG